MLVCCIHIQLICKCILLGDNIRSLWSICNDEYTRPDAATSSFTTNHIYPSRFNWLFSEGSNTVTYIVLSGLWIFCVVSTNFEDRIRLRRPGQSSAVHTLLHISRVKQHIFCPEFSFFQGKDTPKVWPLSDYHLTAIWLLSDCHPTYYSSAV
jgi:hypothetical protein